MIASHGGGKGCATEVNKAVEPFNKKLKDLISEFNRISVVDHAKFTFVDLFSSQNPIEYFILGKYAIYIYIYIKLTALLS